VDLLPDSDQAAIAETFRQFLEAELPLQRLQNATGNTTNDLDCWPDMARLGWFGIALEENIGGAGLSAVEEILLCIEAGKQLVCPTLIATMLAARLAAGTGDDTLACRIIAGEHTIALGMPLQSTLTSTDAYTGDVLLLGHIGEQRPCDYLLVASQEASWLLNLCGTEIPVHGHASIDNRLPIQRITLNHLPAEASAASSAVEIYRHGQLLSAAMAVGLAARVKDLSVAYASEREQFGRPIGSFQSIKHYCADMALRCEAALSLLTQASLELGENSAAANFDVPAAKLLASDAAIQNAEHAIQIHGAMGFTREMSIHHFLKRAHVLASVFGDSRTLLEIIAAQPTPA